MRIASACRAPAAIVASLIWLSCSTMMPVRPLRISRPLRWIGSTTRTRGMSVGRLHRGRRLLVALQALAHLGHDLAGFGRQVARIGGDGDELESEFDHGKSVARRAIVNAGDEAALLGLAQNELDRVS